MERQARLPEIDLKTIQTMIIDHVQSLNDAGTVATPGVTREDALAALGFGAGPESPDAWLCSADSSCGSKS